MSCPECEMLSRAEIDATRQTAAAESALQDYSPQPPFGTAAIAELNRRQRILEESRATANLTRSKRTEHARTHSLTISR